MVNRYRLKVLFEEKGIKNKYIAEQLEVNINKVADFKRGKSTPTEKELSKLAEIFNVSVDYLEGKTDNKNEHLPVSEKAHSLEKYLIENGIIQDLSDKSLSTVLEFLKANEGILKKIIDNTK